jgi:hypothetical protein
MTNDDPDSDALQNATVRDGGAAEGGVTPHADDPSNPEQADSRAKRRDATQRQHGFGDDRTIDPLKD